MERDSGRESVYVSEGKQKRKGGGSCRNTHPDALTTIHIHDLTDGEWRKYTLKILTGCR